MQGPGEGWPLPAGAPILAPGEVHAWRIWLDLPAADLERLAAGLDRDERARAARYHLDRHRHRFIAAHGALRAILGLYLAHPPEAIRFGQGSNGKPLLLPTPGSLDLRFNLAHSRDLAVCVVAHSAEVGADVEAIRPVPYAGRVAARFFSPREQAALRALPASEREEAFYLAWTRKEAYLKALGDGLARSLSGFSVSLRPSEPARLLDVEGQPGEVERWSLVALYPAPGYAAALVAETPLRRVLQWSWAPGPSPSG